MTNLNLFQVYQSNLGFSYGIFFISDPKYNDIADWESVHSEQGFARLPHSITISTLYTFGEAHLNVYRGEFQALRKYDRAIEVPLYLESGKIVIEGPPGFEEIPISIPNGHYKIVVAQENLVPEVDLKLDYDELIDGYSENIDIFLELLDTPLEHSSILIQDSALNPPEILVESANIL